MNSPHRHFHRLAWALVVLTFVLMVFGGFVRLSDAGLSCPDWPTCYGRATWPTQDHEIAQANADYARPVESHKAWREQVHRHIAGALGLGVLGLALLAARRRRFGVVGVLAGATLVALSIPAYTGVAGWFASDHVASGALVSAGLAGLLVLAWRWNNSDATRLSTLLLCVVICQAVLGMWTVIWLVKPLVVMAHLLGGLTTFALLAWLAWGTTPERRLVHGAAPRLRPLLWVGLALLAVQIALGGWTSSNYAALACGTDFPTCLGQWWPQSDFGEGFVLWRGIGVDYEGGVLDGPARTAIQLSHRLMAVLVAGHLGVVGWKLLRTPGLRYWGATLTVLLLAQLGLGVANVVLALPLAVAVAHLGGAAALLFVLVSLLARLRAPQ